MIYMSCPQLNSNNNGPCLLFKSISWRFFCFLSFVATDCKDGNGLKLENFSLKFQEALVWNQIPDNLKHLSRSSFKKKLKISYTVNYWQDLSIISVLKEVLNFANLVPSCTYFLFSYLFIYLFLPMVLTYHCTHSAHSFCLIYPSDKCTITLLKGTWPDNRHYWFFHVPCTLHSF